MTGQVKIAVPRLNLRGSQISIAGVMAEGEMLSVWTPGDAVSGLRIRDAERRLELLFLKIIVFSVNNVLRNFGN